MRQNFLFTVKKNKVEAKGKENNERKRIKQKFSFKY